MKNYRLSRFEKSALEHTRLNPLGFNERCLVRVQWDNENQGDANCACEVRGFSVEAFDLPPHATRPIVLPSCGPFFTYSMPSPARLDVHWEAAGPMVHGLQRVFVDIIMLHDWKVSLTAILSAKQTHLPIGSGVGRGGGVLCVVLTHAEAFRFIDNLLEVTGYGSDREHEVRIWDPELDCLLPDIVAWRIVNVLREIAINHQYGYGRCPGCLHHPYGATARAVIDGRAWDTPFCFSCQALMAREDVFRLAAMQSLPRLWRKRGYRGSLFFLDFERPELGDRYQGFGILSEGNYSLLTLVGESPIEPAMNDVAIVTYQAYEVTLTRLFYTTEQVVDFLNAAREAGYDPRGDFLGSGRERFCDRWKDPRPIEASDVERLEDFY